MKTIRALGFLGSIAFLVALFVVLPGMGAEEKGKDGKAGLYRPLGLFTEVLSLVRTNYVEPVEMKPLLSGAFSGMTEAMDPFADYVSPDRVGAFEVWEARRGRAETIGSGLVLARRVGYPVVVSAIPGSPAAAAGVRGDDILEKVDDRSAHGLSLWEAESLLSGPAGSRVKLLIAREGAKPRRRTVVIVRQSWSPPLPSLSRVEGESVLKIPSFGPGTASEVAKLISPLDRTRALVIDLRENASGAFEEAARTAALFVSAGPLAELTGRRAAPKSFVAEPAQRVHQSRLVLLVDSSTGGSAELFASAIRDGLGRDVPSGTPAAPVRLVGEPTSGMAFTSQVVHLASGGVLKLAVAKVRTLGGKAISPKGLEPDDRVFSMPEDGEHKTGVDPVLRRGLKLLAEMTAAPRASA